MGSFFTKKKKDTRITEQDKAVLQLKVQRDKLKQYTKKLEANLVREKEAARALLKNGRRERVKLLLRKKKFQEGLIQKTENQLETLERLVHDIEFAQIEANVLQSLKEGNDSLKKMHELMSLEDVEKIMDETAEGIKYQQEIDELLAGGLTEEDEDDVLAELDALIEADVEPAKKEELPEDIQLPDVPEDKLEDKIAEKKQKAAEPVMVAS
ncbi:multivesicular body 6 [Octopus vulgaris]|uniref:Multivesicular body 6 n=2 Tax=Octopus TaxID=6643 RepID=A0AA36F086_OCTVU|nr:charged multivesicular body protein 6-A [Octopus sinensis]CAI9720831.1 multivesicular body 6 [Octopus vulgaris]